MLLMKKSVLSLKEKKTQHGFSYFQIASTKNHLRLTN